MNTPQLTLPEVLGYLDQLKESGLQCSAIVPWLREWSPRARVPVELVWCETSDGSECFVNGQLWRVRRWNLSDNTHIWSFVNSEMAMGCCTLERGKAEVQRIAATDVINRLMKGLGE